MKIVHIICSLCTGGAELLLLDLLRCQQAAGHELGLVVINDRYELDLCRRIPEGIKTVFVNRHQGSKNPWWLLKYNISLRQLRPDVVHFHHDAAVGMTSRSFLDALTVLTVHDTGINLRYISRPDALFAISEAVDEDIKRRYGAESVVVHNGVPVDSIAFSHHTSQNMSEFHIIQISRLDHDKKGQDLLIKAVGRLKTEGYRLKVDFIGVGSEENYLRSLAEECGVGDDISFLGRRSRDYIYSHLCEYDVLVQPSRYEGFGLTVAEGMAAGIPVLVSDIEGPMEVIGHGRYGSSFKCGSADDLAEKIRHIYDNFDAARNLAQGEAREYCRRNFSVDATARAYIDQYKRLIK